jgi:hypothetical protein
MPVLVVFQKEGEEDEESCILHVDTSTVETSAIFGTFFVFYPPSTRYADEADGDDP